MRRATIRTTHDDPATIADALRPDNTDAMTTAADDDTVATTIERPSASGLRTTVDDYLVNLTTAAAVGDGASATGPGDDQSDARTTDDTTHNP